MSKKKDGQILMSDEGKMRKESLKNFIYNNIKAILCVVLLCAVLFPFGLCIVLKWIANSFSGDLLEVVPAIEQWFAFFASYSGTVTSIIVGLVTLYLTVVIEKQNEETQKREHRLSIATNMPNMSCKEMRLFSLGQADFPNEQIMTFDKASNYILSLKMTPAFPPYFKVSIKNICVQMKNQCTGEAMKKCADLSKEDYRIINNENIDTIINIPRELDVHMQDIYMLNSMTFSGTEHEKKLVDIWIEFKCKNVLLSKRQDKCADVDVDFKLHLVVENMGKIDDKGKKFEIVDRQFEL